MQIVVKDVQCPKCGAKELHPKDKNKVLIRAFKVEVDGHWWSQCLVCAGYYDKDTLNETPQFFLRATGWFR